MNIGIDVDGVLTNIESYIYEYGTRYAYQNGYSLKNFTGDKYNTEDMFSWTREEDEKFWISILEDYAKNEKPRKFASEVIQKLVEKGHKIYIITARYSMTERDIKKKRIEKILIKWLRKHKIKYNQIIFAQDKQNAIIDNHIDIMIEDSPENIKQLKEYTNMIVFHTSYNTEVPAEDAKRVYGWYQVLDYIDNM